MAFETLAKPKQLDGVPISYPAKASFQSRAAAFGLLDNLRPQENIGGARTRQIKQSPGLAALENLLSQAMSIKPEGSGLRENNYEKLLPLVQGLQCTSRDIEALSFIIEKYAPKYREDALVGLFFSALMNNSNESDFSLFVQNSPVPLEILGFRNNKNISINGDVGGDLGYLMECGSIILQGNATSHIGYGMESGTIEVFGSVEDNAGYFMHGGSLTVNRNAGIYTGNSMQNGNITINGSCGKGAGHNMYGGIITINGNAGARLGYEMNGGTIIVNGNILSFSTNIKGGDIFQFDRQIVKGGKIIAPPQNRWY